MKILYNILGKENGSMLPFDSFICYHFLIGCPRTDSSFSIQTEPFLSTLQKVIFSSGCKYFFMLAVIFCLLKNNYPMQKCGYSCLQIWSRNLHNWHFLEIFVQIPKTNSSQSCIKCIFAVQKKLYAACTNKTSP